MKSLMILAAILFAGAAQADCKNRFGTIVDWKLNGDRLSLQFSHPTYKKDAARFNGESKGWSYFRKGPGDLVAIVENTVFESGKGRLVYRKKVVSSKGQAHHNVNFYCK